MHRRMVQVLLRLELQLIELGTEQDEVSCVLRERYVRHIVWTREQMKVCFPSAF